MFCISCLSFQFCISGFSIFAVLQFNHENHSGLFLYLSFLLVFLYAAHLGFLELHLSILSLTIAFFSQQVLIRSSLQQNYVMATFICLYVCHEDNLKSHRLVSAYSKFLQRLAGPVICL